MDQLIRLALAKFRERRKENPKEDLPDAIHEIADSCVPVYTYYLLNMALEDLSLAVEKPENLAFGGKSTAVAAIAGVIYQRIEEELYAEAESEEEDN